MVSSRESPPPSPGRAGRAGSSGPGPARPHPGLRARPPAPAASRRRPALSPLTQRRSLVDDITYSAATHSADGPTSSAILGPFWRADTPRRANGASISLATPAGAQPVYMWGRVTDAATGEPLPGATVDVWQASTNGAPPPPPAPCAAPRRAR